MANGTDEDEAQAERMDRWETEEGNNLTPFLTVFYCVTVLRGTHAPELYAQRNAGGGGFSLFCGLSLVRVVCISLRDEKGPKQKCDSNKINKNRKPIIIPSKRRSAVR